jgi:hypothetical protein
MTERKPFGEAFETFVDRQIREARERGDFDDLPGKGKPLRGLDETDELWWVRRKLAEEGLSYAPPSLVLRREAERALADALDAATEAGCRSIIGAVNDQIRAANRRRLEGPPLNLVPYDVDDVVTAWRRRHPG